MKECGTANFARKRNMRGSGGVVHGRTHAAGSSCRTSRRISKILCSSASRSSGSSLPASFESATTACARMKDSLSDTLSIRLLRRVVYRSSLRQCQQKLAGDKINAHSTSPR